MKKIYNPSKEDWPVLLKRPTQSVEEIEFTVGEIFKEVQVKGDTAIKKYTALFDGVSINEMLVSKGAIKEALEKVPVALKTAIQKAKTNIEKFHAAQRTTSLHIETSPGVQCWQEKRPIQRVGLYIPGGTAPLFSTVLMLAIPAKLAGCEEIILCTPPHQNESVDPAILYAAQLCGVQQIYKIGGIQAIAGMTFGTESLLKVSKIFGPGNQFVTVAKQMATKFGVAIDMPAGPSELLIIADTSAAPSFVAADLLSQAEHGEDSQVLLVTTSQELIDQVDLEVETQLAQLPRKAIAEKAMENSKLIFLENDKLALEFINEYGPEHFMIMSQKEDFYIDGIHNAGSVFIGNYTPESAGDYASGTNHTLPTNGFSKAYSGVNLDSFMKAMTFQKISKKGILDLGSTIEIMAEAEGLQAHKKAVSIRLNSLKNE